MTQLLSSLDQATVDALRRDSLTAEVQGRLSPTQLKMIAEKKWFHLFVPNEYGGLALSLPEAVRLEEHLAYTDGSIGWLVTLCGGAGFFIGYMDESLVQKIFTHNKICLAGSGQTTGTAKMINGEYEVNGIWPYASGAPYATHFTANCILENNGESRSFVFTKEEVQLHPNWNYLGLNATAGFSFSVKNLRIPANRMFMIDPAHAILPAPVYRYPFLQLAQTTIAANLSGMCLYFFDLAGQLLQQKQMNNRDEKNSFDRALQTVASGHAAIVLLRQNFYLALDESWSAHLNNDISIAQLNAVSETSLRLAQDARDLANQLYPFCGLSAARMDSEINLVWRNINTAGQHSLLLKTF
jgi:alkylation response protein AidB-like acyl-CoA dehydrogenase